MAKKVAETEKKKIDIFKTLQKVDDSVEIINQSVMSNINDWIDTGNYVLNACIGGSLFRGAPGGRITILAGESGCLKNEEKIEIYRLKTYISKHELLKYSYREE